MNPEAKQDQPVTVRELVEALDERLDLVVVAGTAGLDRELPNGRIQKPGLALAGPRELLYHDRTQVLGRSEVRYLASDAPEAASAIERLCRGGIPALLVTRGLEAPAALVARADETGTPLICTPRETGQAMEQLYQYLGVRLAPRARVHGVLLDIFGLGVLVVGESGIGKSECALELVTRGHRLVADDAVDIRRIEDELIGAAPELSRYFLEVRGLGLINTREMFGITAIRETKVIEQAVRLVHYEPGVRYDRLGDSERYLEALGVKVPLFELPVAPGRNLAVLLEIAARQRLLREQGSDACREIQASLARRLGTQHDHGDKGGPS